MHLRISSDVIHLPLEASNLRTARQFPGRRDIVQGRGRSSGPIHSVKGRGAWFDTSICGCEVPIGFGVEAVAVALPGGDFLDGSLPVGDASIGERMGVING